MQCQLPRCRDTAQARRFSRLGSPVQRLQLISKSLGSHTGLQSRREASATELHEPNVRVTLGTRIEMALP